MTAHAALFETVPTLQHNLNLQGTNAHVTLEVTPESVGRALFHSPQQLWKRTRHWFRPAPHALLTSARLMEHSSLEAEVLMHGTPLAKPSASFLREMSVNGAACLPVAAAVEVRSPCLQGSSKDADGSLQVDRNIHLPHRVLTQLELMKL